MMTILQPAGRFLKTWLHAVSQRLATLFSSAGVDTHTPVASPVLVKHCRPEHSADDPAAQRPPHIDFGNAYHPDEGRLPEDQWLKEMSSWSPDDAARFYAGGKVSRESLEGWMSAGLLYPEEVRAAEKIIKEMRQRAV